MAASKRVTILADRVVYGYGGNVATEQLFALYQALAANGIGPQVFAINGNSITVEKIPLLAPGYEDGDLSLNPELAAWLSYNGYPAEETVSAALNRTMTILHDTIGYCHADAHPGNMGYRIDNNELSILLFDLDNAFPISIGRYMPSVLDWIENSYDDMTYEDIIQYDFGGAIMMLDFP